MSEHLSDPLAGCQAYLDAHRHHAERREGAVLPIITMSREAGAGAVTIGEWAAQLLNRDRRGPDAPPWTVFDKNLVERVIADHQFPETLERFMPEDIYHGVTSAVEEILGLHPSAWNLAQQTTETILRLAHLGHAILVGRGANLITARMRPALHVRLVAPLEQRLAHLEEFHHLTPSEAAVYAKKADQGRRRYVKRYFNASIDDPLHYTLTINTGRMDYRAAAHVIAEAVRQCCAGVESKTL